MLPQLSFCALGFLLLTVTWSCRAQNVAFSVEHFQEGKNILLDGNCGVSGDGFLQQLGGAGPDDAFRAVYPHPVQFYDAESGAEASFSVRFSFPMKSVKHKLAMGGGLSFIIAPERTVPSGSGGSGLGLYRNSANATEEDRHLLAVELDSCFDSGIDPANDSDHVGLNINSIVSAKTQNLPACGLSLDSAYYPELAAFIEYFPDIHELPVFMAPDSTSAPLLVLSYSGLDLASIVQPYSYVGFTGSTSAGHSLQTSVLSWSFSTSGLPPKLAASGVPQTLATVPHRTLADEPFLSSEDYQAPSAGDGQAQAPSPGDNQAQTPSPGDSEAQPPPPPPPPEDYDFEAPPPPPPDHEPPADDKSSNGLVAKVAGSVSSVVLSLGVGISLLLRFKFNFRFSCCNGFGKGKKGHDPEVPSGSGTNVHGNGFGHVQSPSQSPSPLLFNTKGTRH